MKLKDLVSVGVVVWNAWSELEKALKSHNEHTPKDVKMIIVDNNSGKQTRKFLRQQTCFPVVTIFNEKNKGFAGANNQIIDSVNTPYLCLINPDVIVCKDYLSKLIAAFERHKGENIGVLGCKLQDGKGKLYHEGVGYRQRKDGLIEPVNIADLKWSNGEKDYEAIAVTFAAVLISSEVYTKFKLDEESFPLGFFEDISYCKTVRKAGYKVFYTPDVFMTHLMHQSWRIKGLRLLKETSERGVKEFNRQWGEELEDTNEWLGERL